MVPIIREVLMARQLTWHDEDRQPAFFQLWVQPLQLHQRMQGVLQCAVGDDEVGPSIRHIGCLFVHLQPKRTGICPGGRIDLDTGLFPADDTAQQVPATTAEIQHAEMRLDVLREFAQIRPAPKLTDR